MELSRVIEILKPRENVAPDLSSYAAMVAKWRGSLPVPTLAQCLATWAVIKASDDAIKYKTDRRKAIDEAKVTLEDKINALWDIQRNNNRAEFNRIETILIKAEQDFPKP